MRKLLILLGAFLFWNAPAVFAQGQVTGKVTDTKGDPISGASVKVKGSTKGTSTNLNGTFSIDIPQNEATLEFSGVDVINKSQLAKVGEMLFVTLEQNTKNLNEVVVTALGIKREKRNLTYSAQEVKGDALVAAKQDNIVNALAGKVAGVQITNSTGMPGSSSRIVIRGATSLNGDNQALFIIDGIPMDNTEAGAQDPFGAGPTNTSLNQGSTSNRAIDLDPNLIESVTVLKGAAATALYGSAAARGAIIITTKSGAGGKAKNPSITLSTNYGFNTAILAEIQDKYAQGLKDQYIDGNNGQFGSRSWGPLLDTLRVNGQPVAKHNPGKDFFRTGHTFDNNLSISGSGDKSKYLISYSYLKNEGIMPNTDFTRHSVFAKFSNQVTNNVNATIQFNYINSDNNRMAEGNNTSSPLWTVYSAPISWEPFPTTNPDGSQRLYRTGRNNPYYLLANTKSTSNVNRFLPVATIVYNPLKWLSITERIGADIYTDQSHYHESNKIIGGLFGTFNGGVTNRIQNFRQYNHDLIIEARKQLSADLFGSVTVGNNIFSQYSQYNTQTASGLAVDEYYNINNGASASVIDVYSLYRKVGYYVQANAEYKKMLVLALTGRVDGTSVLARGKNYYKYGSAAVGFIFSELLKDKIPALSFGKVRASFSSVGNDNVLPYSLTTPFTSPNGGINNINFPFVGQNGFLLSNTLGNADLKNEKLDEFEVGLELKLLNNRLSFEGSYFNRKSTDLLTVTPLAYSSGFFQAVLNVGDMEDKGFELLLGATPIKTKNLTWDLNINFTKIKNKVLELGQGIDKIQFGGFGGGGGTYAFKDLPYGVLFGSKYKRNADGKILVDDDGLPLQADAGGIIGNTNPDWNAGLTSTLTYKAFALNFSFDWKKGGDIYNLDNHYNWFYGTPKVTENRAPRILDAIRESDGKPNTTEISAQDYYEIVSDIDEAVVEDGTYIKLRTVGLSYTLTQSNFKRLPFKAVSISVSGNNLWFYTPHFTGSDPESSLSGSGNGQGIFNYLTPTSRSVTLGLKVSF